MGASTKSKEELMEMAVHVINAVDETDRLVDTVGYGSVQHEAAKAKENKLRSELAKAMGFNEVRSPGMTKIGNLLQRARRERNKRRKASMSG